MTDLEKVLLTFVLTVIAAMVVQYFKDRDKVSIKELEEAKKHLDDAIDGVKKERVKAWADHTKFCPEKRELMTEPDHDVICRRNLLPIQTTISEIKETHVRLGNAMEKMAESMSSMAQAQAKMLTVNDLRKFIASVKNPFGMDK